MKKQVSDILEAGLGPVSFLQIDHNEGTYMGVCPWCTKDLNEVKANTFGDLYINLVTIQTKHMDICKERRSTKMKIFM
jgi:hypothetical protein